MAGEAAHGGETTTAAIPNAPSPSPLPSSRPPPSSEPPINPLLITDEQGANTYKHLLRESVRLHPNNAPSFENIVGGDSSAPGSVEGGGGGGDNGLIPFSRLKFVRKVGSGAFAKVDICEYRPANGSEASKVAVKRLTPGVSVLGMVDLAVEARLLRTLHHPYITGFVGVGKDDRGQGFLVEEFVDGGLEICLIFSPSSSGSREGERETESERARERKRERARERKREREREREKGKLTTLASLSFPSPPLFLPPPPPTHTHHPRFPPGGTLNRLVSRQASKPHKTLYSHAQAACWAQQIAEALAYLHGSNPVIVHRDLKLANVLLRAPRDPRARKRMERGESSVREAAGLSAGGGVVAAVAGGGGGGREGGAAGAAAVPAAAAAAPAASNAAARSAACCGRGEDETPTVALCDFGLSSSFIDPSVPYRRSALHAAAQARAQRQQQQQQRQQRQQQQQQGAADLPSIPFPSIDALSSVHEGGLRCISPTGGVSLDTRRGSSVREQFARVSRGEEMDDHALAGRSAAVGAALEGAGPFSSSVSASSARPRRPPPPDPSAAFRAGRSRARRPVLGAKGGTSAEMTGRTGSFM